MIRDHDPKGFLGEARLVGLDEAFSNHPARASTFFEVARSAHTDVQRSDILNLNMPLPEGYTWIVDEPKVNFPGQAQQRKVRICLCKRDQFGVAVIVRATWIKVRFPSKKSRIGR